jgi:hypothetical protein
VNFKIKKMKRTLLALYVICLSFSLFAEEIPLKEIEREIPGTGRLNDRETIIVPIASIENGVINIETELASWGPGFGDYLCNREYEFFPSNGDELEMDEKYIYIWTIYEEQDDGQDAVELGKATLEHRESESMAYITFLRSGLYTISVDIYTGDDEFVCRYMCQANVL